MVRWKGWGKLCSKTLLLLAAAVPLGFSTACQSDEPKAIMVSHRVTEEHPVPWSYQCAGVNVGPQTESLGNKGDEFWTHETIGKGKVEIVVGSKDQVIGRQVYDLEFVESGKSDRFTVSAPNGDVWTWITWGDHECSPCPPPPYEPLPGDVSGCGYVKAP
jgi:hypothetical protein